MATTKSVFTDVIESAIESYLTSNEFKKEVSYYFEDTLQDLAASAINRALQGKEIKAALEKEIKLVLNDDKLIKKLALTAVKNKLAGK